ncbi:PH domain-containing protein [Alkalihalobacillus hwajinpoensis]|uniref:PH domain-containing protein n=1 Tax=Guptibacillus hwajinpoensis TaxID=208199 RepID=UPI001883A8A5|nr:PH domain-containing protein [Pseudalkalibacillus hwajinpoensis]MBF0709485.1 PH domain-containing protein [Pseudalkalibacillus hwajinpoensis]
MRLEPSKQIDPQGLKVWQITGGLVSLLAIALLCGLFVIHLMIVPIPLWTLVISCILALLFFLLQTWVLPRLRWSKWRYEVTEHEIELKYGVIVVKRTLIPMVRVQHVDTRQGPLLRAYRLSSVTISTAATTHEIPALSNDIADELRDRISVLARVAEEDV